MIAFYKNYFCNNFFLILLYNNYFADFEQFKKLTTYFADFKQVKNLEVIFLTLNKSKLPWEKLMPMHFFVYSKEKK